MERTAPPEHFIPLDSPEALPILDAWFTKWTGIFRSLYTRTKRVQTDLSGGFDSRLTFMLSLRSGIDMNTVCVHSINDPGVHFYSEDYEIASRIAKDFGVVLNRELPENTYENWSLEEIVNTVLYSRINLHKECHFFTRKHLQKEYIITGCCGELMRSCWSTYTPESLLESYIHRVSGYAEKGVYDRLTRSVTQVLTEEYKRVQEACHIEDDSSSEIPSALYCRARAKNHFGQHIEEHMFSNLYMITPLTDPALLQLKSISSTCQSEYLLYALIMERFCPKLLEYPFQDGTSITPETILTARAISAAHPYTPPCDTGAEPFVLPEDETPPEKQPAFVSPQSEETFFKTVFHSEEFMKSVLEEYPFPVLFFAKAYSEVKNFHPLKEYFPLLLLILTKKAIGKDSDAQSFFQFLSGMSEPERAYLQNDLNSRFWTRCRRELNSLIRENNKLKTEISGQRIELAGKQETITGLKSESAGLKAELAGQKKKSTPYTPRRGPLRRFRRAVHKIAVLWGTRGTRNLCARAVKKVRKKFSHHSAENGRHKAQA